MEDNRNIIATRPLVHQVHIEVVDAGSARGTPFQVYRSVYKLKKNSSSETKLRETRVLFSAETKAAAKGYMNGYCEGFVNARST